MVVVALYSRFASSFATGVEVVEPEPEPGELHPVDYRYRCVVCGTEVTMTAAPTDEAPTPPRHCREDMALVVEAEGP